MRDAQGKQLDKLNRKQLEEIERKLEVTKKVTRDTVWKLRRREIKAEKVSGGLYTLQRKIHYRIGRLRGQSCPAREDEGNGYFTCHCKEKNTWQRTMWFQEFYPNCRHCTVSAKVRLKQGVFGKALATKKDDYGN